MAKRIFARFDDGVTKHLLLKENKRRLLFTKLQNHGRAVPAIALNSVCSNESWSVYDNDSKKVPSVARFHEVALRMVSFRDNDSKSAIGLRGFIGALKIDVDMAAFNAVAG